MFKHSLPNMEKFAAFLDGNLSEREMQEFSQLADHDSGLHQLLDASAVVDNTLAGYSETDLQLPPEIVGSDFELPTIPDGKVSPLVTLTPETMIDLHVAAAACADEDVSSFSDVNQDDDSMIKSGISDDPSQLMPENEGFGNGEDLSSSPSEDY